MYAVHVNCSTSGHSHLQPVYEFCQSPVTSWTGPMPHYPMNLITSLVIVLVTNRFINVNALVHCIQTGSSSWPASVPKSKTIIISILITNCPTGMSSCPFPNLINIMCPASLSVYGPVQFPPPAYL